MTVQPPSALLKVTLLNEELPGSTVYPVVTPANSTVPLLASNDAPLAFVNEPLSVSVPVGNTTNPLAIEVFPFTVALVSRNTRATYDSVVLVA